MIRVRCPQCRKGLGLKDELGGKKIKCPHCTSILTVPASAATVAAQEPPPASPGKPASPPAKPTNDGDDYTPYSIEAVHQVATEAKDDRVDELVLHALKQKARNRAWMQVGFPSTWLKRVALISCWIIVFFFLWTTVNCVLYSFNMEKLSRLGKLTEKRFELGYYFPLDEIWDRDDAPGFVFVVTLGITLFLLVYLAIIIKGAEAMKRLEEYNWAMASAILGLFYPFTIPFAVFALVGLRDPGVIHEFNVSARRARGITDYEAELEEEEDDDDDDEDDADEDEEDEDEEEERPRRRRR